jgi:hypothetical protein
MYPCLPKSHTKENSLDRKRHCVENGSPLVSLLPYRTDENAWKWLVRRWALV